MRRNPTDAEEVMWRLLRETFNFARFRRQVPLNSYIVDFASHSEKLVIEVDGGQHDRASDARRTQDIETAGYRVLRFWNDDVLTNEEDCVSDIAAALRNHSLPTRASEQARKPSFPAPIKGEGDFIAALRSLATSTAARGLEDDAAVLEVGGETLILTHDAMVEGIHWLPAQDLADVAWKLIAVNLSDLAAKGAEPLGVLLGYQLGEDDADFLRGLKEALETFDVPLLGGDTVAANGARSLGLTAIGRATHVPVPSRSGACAGEEVWLCGSLGAALLGFEALRDNTGADSEAYRRPRPLIEEGKALASRASAMMDVSDGLLLDCWRLATASDVCIRLERKAMPVAAPDRFDECMRWGDDYALLFTLPEGLEPPVSATRIGYVEPDSFAPLWLDDEILTPADGLGYRHGD